MTELPTTFGKYFLTDKLAVGGMAEIFLAKLIGPGGFEKAMVIKQIHPALSSQRAFVDLFVAEAKTLVSLSQSNIVPIYELGVVDDTYFIAMEYVDGPTLWQLTEAVLARGDAMAPAIAAHVAAEIAKGLDYAHRKGAGVIHRDLSPRNVMVTRDGEVKLVDFGIAVGLGESTDAGDGGLPTGSFAYMSPEQARREPLTGQTDLFSLGVLTWEMVTGQRLFGRADADATLAAVTSAPIVAPSTIQPELPARLDAIVMRMLERDTAARWPNAAEVSAALQRFLADETELRGGRDLAALVARVCPPTVSGGRDAPATHHDAVEAASGDGGPSTQVVPRSGPRGKRRPTVREATFATHVELDRVLGPVTGTVTDTATDTVTDTVTDTATDTVTDTVTDTATGTFTDTVTAADASSADAPTGEYLPPTGSYDRPEPSPAAPLRAVAAPSAPPARAGWLVLVGALAVVAFAVSYVQCRPRAPAVGPVDAPVAADAAAPVDASAPPIDAAPPPIDAVPIDTVPTDARASVPRDAVPRDPFPRDARELGLRDAAAAAGTGRLRVGANPWGEVFLDGKRLGRAPNEWTVTAGRHQVEVVFPGDDTELRRRFDVDVPAGGTDSVMANFTTP